MKALNGTAGHGCPREAGFSLVEVMVTLIVMSVGLLGIAKMQALALTSTTSARMRSLVALEASSLASTMRADRAYWASVTADPIVQFASGAITKTQDNTLQPNATCPCTPPQIAFGDLREWVQNLSQQVKDVQGTVSCTVPLATAPAPVSCTISLNWPENLVAANAQQAQAAQQAQTPPPRITYTLYVDP
jgi:type IV pilus assembly protein PilV